MTETNKQILVIRNQLVKELPQIKKDLPSSLSIDATRICKSVMFELNKNKALQKCSPMSVISSVLQASQLGLEIGGTMGQAYLIPFWNSKEKVSEAQFVLGYRGMIELGRRSGQMLSLDAHCVYENDEFELEYGIHEKLRHIPTRGKEPGNLIGAYAVARFKDGGYQFKFIEAWRLEKLKETQLAKIKNEYARKYSPWEAYFDEMSCKTAVRRLFKYIPISIEQANFEHFNILQKAIKLDEDADAGMQDNKGYDLETGEINKVAIEQLNDDKMSEVFEEEVVNYEAVIPKKDGFQLDEFMGKKVK